MKKNCKTFMKNLQDYKILLGILLFAFLMPVFFTNVNAEEKVTFDSYKIYSYREDSMGVPPNGVESTDGCHVVIEATFGDDLTLTDAQSVSRSFTLTGNTSVGSFGRPEVTVDGNLLTLDFSATYLPGGVVQFEEADLDGLMCGDDSVYWPGDFCTVVPTGLAFHVTDVTIGTEDTPASTTIQMDSSAVMRSMNHILWTSNVTYDDAGEVTLENGGTSLFTGTGTDQTSTAHHHTFYNFTLGTSVYWIVDGVGSGDTGTGSVKGYSVTSDHDTITITAPTAIEGEYVGIYNYDDNFLQEYGLTINDAVTGLPCPEVQTQLDISKRAVVTMDDVAEYTGEAIEPAVTVSDRGYKNGSYGYALTEGVDYEVSYADNVDLGSTATVTITGLGAYEGSQVQKTFRIAKQLEASMFDVDVTDEDYTGTAHRKTVTPLTGLVEDEDYTVFYANNVNAGESTVRITGAGLYYGTVEFTYQILPLTITADQFTVDTSTQTYTGSAIEPTVTSTLKKSDYSVSYKNNVNAGTASIVIEGTGNYAGTLTYTFTIEKKETAKSSSALGTAVIKKLTPKKKKLKVQWSSVGAKKYKVSYRVKGTKKWKNKTTTKTSITLKKLKKGKKYQVKVTAINGSQKTVSKVKVSKKIK